MTERLVYRVERARLDVDNPEDVLAASMSFGIRENPELLSPASFALERARDFRAKHAYHGEAFSVTVWPERPGEHFRQAAPLDAAEFDFPEGWPLYPAKDMTTGSPLWTEEDRREIWALRCALEKKPKAELVRMAAELGIVGAHPVSSWRKDEIAGTVAEAQWERAHPMTPRPARGSAPVGFHERRP